MTSYFDLVRTFGEDRVTSVDYEQLREAGVGPSAAMTLADVGLPTEVPLVFTTQVIGEPQVFSLHDFGGVDGEASRILVIGGSPGDQEVRFFLDVRHSLVGIFDLTEGAPRMETVNSTIHDFVGFLHQFGIYMPKIRASQGEERAGVITALRSTLHEWDAPALAVSDSWWSIVMEQLSDPQTE